MRIPLISCVTALVLACSMATWTETPRRVTAPPEVRVDVNQASMEQLAKVPGLTRSWAGRIVRFRPYRSKRDLLDRGVLPGDVYERIKDYLIAHREQQPR